MKLAQLEKAKSILIYGFGREGTSSYKFLRRRFPKKKIVVYDKMKKGARIPSLKKFDVVVVSPGVSEKKLKGARPTTLTSNNRIFFDNIPEEKRKRVIGITGTKGKSTTTKFCAELLANAGWRVRGVGNIGLPLLDSYDSLMRGRLDYVVVELSSYQLGTLHASPGIALFLNLYPEHLNRHGSFARYADAKKNIWKFQAAEDVVIAPKKLKPIIVSPRASAPRSRVLLAPRAPATLFPKDSIFSSAHFRDNFGAVCKLANLLHISNSTLRTTAKKFRGLPYRMEHFATKKGIRFYDDSLSTNPDSTLAAVRFFGKRLGAIVLGGQDRGQHFDELAKALKTTGAVVIILGSETSAGIARAMKKNGVQKWHHAATLKEAVARIYELANPGSCAVLSPAAPSYDRFKNYEEKGSAFKKFVTKVRV